MGHTSDHWEHVGNATEHWVVEGQERGLQRTITEPASTHHARRNVSRRDRSYGNQHDRLSHDRLCSAPSACTRWNISTFGKQSQQTQDTCRGLQLTVPFCSQRISETNPKKTPKKAPQKKHPPWPAACRFLRVQPPELPQCWPEPSAPLSAET